MRRICGVAKHMMGMSTQSRKKEEAWEFIKYLVSKEGQTMACDDGNNIPALRAVAESDLFLKNKNTPNLSNQIFLDELPYAREWPFEPSPYVSNYAFAQFWAWRAQTVLGRQTVMEILQSIQEGINGIIARQKHVALEKPFVGSVMFFIGIVIVLGGGGIALTRRRKTISKTIG
jgi:ABC-type glycerol-3-phosphate transport system substrate-binding protein